MTAHRFPPPWSSRMKPPTMASGSSGTIPAIGRLYSGDQGDGIMPSTEQDDATFDYENSPWVGDRTLARIRYEQLEELNNPVLVREALGLSGGNPTSTITIDPHDIRRPVLVPRGFRPGLARPPGRTHQTKARTRKSRY